MGMLRRWYGRYLVWTRLETVQAWDRRVAGGLLFVLVLLLLVLAVQWVPEWQVRRAGVHATGVAEKPFTQADVAGLQNEMRKTFIQVVGGLFVVIGVWFTYRRTKVAEQGHITDRYTKAIEQLGALTSDGKPNVEVRLGAIYALERIAFDSPRDHWTIMEVLTAYVRQNAPAPVVTMSEEENRKAIAKGPATEIQAILTVLRRRRRIAAGRKLQEVCIDLRGSDLRGAWFGEAHLESSAFMHANVEGAMFIGTRLEGANFYGARVANAWFMGAHFAGTQLLRVEGATVEQMRLARNWEGARYDEGFAAELGLIEVQNQSLSSASVGETSPAP